MMIYNAINAWEAHSGHGGDSSLVSILRENQDRKIHSIRCVECNTTIATEYDMSVIPYSPILYMLVETHIRNRHKYSNDPFGLVNFSVTVRDD